MKKFFKKFSLALAFITCFGLASPLIAPLRVFADPIPTEYEVLIEGGIIVPDFEPETTKGDEYEIADGLVGGNPLILATVTVKNPFGVDVTDTEVTDGFLTPNYAGIYTITYSYNNYSTDLKLNVSGITQGVEITFEENSQYIIPSTINPEYEDDALSITLPNPIVVDAEGEIMGDAVVETTVTFSGTGTNFELLLNNFTDEDEVVYDVLVLDPDSNGTYTITYNYYVGAKVVAYIQKTIKADLSYDNDFDFSYKYGSTKPETAEIGVAKKLPTVTGYNTTSGIEDDEIEVYYTVEAQITVGDTTTTFELDDETGVITFEEGAYYFTPILDGDYVITYTVKNIFGKEATVSSSSFEIEDVADTTAPKPIVVMPYTEDDLDANGVLTDYTDATEAIANYNSLVNILLFPIYATDSANGIVKDNLTLYRTIKDSSNTSVFNEKDDIEENVNGKILVFNSIYELTGIANHEVFKVNINGEDISITESQIYVVSESDSDDKLLSGTHTVLYYAYDKAGNGTDYKTFPMRLEQGFSDEEAPIVTFPENLPVAVFLNEEVTFRAPTAADQSTQPDSRLSVYVTYFVTVDGNDLEKIRADNDISIISYDEDTQEYSFTITDNTIEKITIKAYSQDNSGNEGFAQQSVIILNAGDSEPTTITSNNINIEQNENGYVQGNDIVLPTVVYGDDLVNYLNIEVIIENNGVYYTSYDATIVRSGTALTYSNAKFCANQAGEYTITYISTDAENNKTILMFGLTIATNWDDVVIEFTGLGSQINNGTAEKGETIQLPIPSLVFDTDLLELVGGTYDVIITGPTNRDLLSNYIFIPKEVGNYKIQYKAILKVKATGVQLDPIESAIFDVDVVDTTGPVFVDFTEIESFFAGLNNFQPGVELDIPLPEFSDNDVDLSASYVKVSTTSGITYTIYLNESENLFDYDRFTTDNTYTIKYVLIDNYGNETSKSVTLDVGDCEAPELTVEDDLLNAEYAIGDEIEIDFSKISAIDEIDGDIILYNESTGIYSLKEDASISITVKNTTTGDEYDLTSENDDLRFSYEIETAGSYKVTIEIGDTSGKIATYDNITFTVGAEDNIGMTAEEILGTILIIISVLMLGGVITYFVVSKKKLESKYKK